jgi:hypothetical protein
VDSAPISRAAVVVQIPTDNRPCNRSSVRDHTRVEVEPDKPVLQQQGVGGSTHTRTR